MIDFLFFANTWHTLKLWTNFETLNDSEYQSRNFAIRILNETFLALWEVVKTIYICKLANIFNIEIFITIPNDLKQS